MTSDSGTDIRCPSCQQVTAPGAFCTRCGAALPFDIGFRSDSRAEIQERMRLRREGRLGAAAAGGVVFEPEPTDTLRAAEDEPVLPAEPVLSAEPVLPAEPVWPAQPEPLADPVAPITAVDVDDEVSAPPESSEPVIFDADPVPPPPPRPPRPPRPARPAGGGGGKGDGVITPAVFVGFLVLGLIALLGGAALGGVFRDGEVAVASPTPTASQSAPTPTIEATPPPSLGESPTPRPSDAPPTSFPDGFLARAEPCADEPTGPSCDASGASNRGDLWVLVSFRHATFQDVIGVAIVDSAGNLVADASLDLGFCGTSTDCAGYTYFPFTNLAAGDYRVRVTRNGTPAAETTFEVVP